MQRPAHLVFLQTYLYFSVADLFENPPVFARLGQYAGVSAFKGDLALLVNG